MFESLTLFFYILLNEYVGWLDVLPSADEHPGPEHEQPPTHPLPEGLNPNPLEQPG